MEDDISTVSIAPSLFRKVLTRAKTKSTKSPPRAHLMPESELSYWRIRTYLDPSLSDWMPSLYIGPRPPSKGPQFSICCSTVSTSREYIIELLSSCYFEYAPRFLWTPAYTESTTGAAIQTGSMDDLSISLVETLAGL